MVVWETVLVPLAEPGSGMYHAAMDRVKGTVDARVVHALPP
jgi:hypothetical protein